MAYSVEWGCRCNQPGAGRLPGKILISVKLMVSLSLSVANQKAPSPIQLPQFSPNWRAHKGEDVKSFSPVV